MADITQSNLNNEHEELPYYEEEIDGARELLEAEQRANTEAEIRSVKANSITVGDILDRPPRKIHSYAPHFAIAGGLSLLSAPPKEGKSTLLLDVLGALTTNKPVLGESTNHAKVVYAFEQSEHVLFDQLKETPVPSLVGNKDIHIIPLEKNGKLLKVEEDEHGQCFGIRQPFTNWTEQLNYWISELQTHKAEILVLDTWSAFALLAGGEANDAGIVVQKLTLLKQAVFAYNCNTAIIINHHLRKINPPGREPNMEDIMGSTGMRSVPDCNLLLWNPKLKDRPNVRKLKIEGRFGVVPDRYIELTPDGFVVCADEVKQEAKKEADEQDVLFNAHRANPDLESLGIRGVAAEVDVSEWQVRKFRGKYPPAARFFQKARDEGGLKDLQPFGYNFGGKD